jgi:hypothetical protein
VLLIPCVYIKAVIKQIFTDRIPDINNSSAISIMRATRACVRQAKHALHRSLYSAGNAVTRVVRGACVHAKTMLTLFFPTFMILWN